MTERMAFARAAYRRAGHPHNNGDAVARALKEAFHTESGLDLKAFLDCCRSNGVKMGKWSKNIDNPGAIRMSGGLLLRAVLRRTGKITIGGTVVTG